MDALSQLSYGPRNCGGFASYFETPEESSVQVERMPRRRIIFWSPNREIPRTSAARV